MPTGGDSFALLNGEAISEDWVGNMVKGGGNISV
jgi:hypothetical protein